jgi:CarD family transcriptional regulator
MEFKVGENAVHPHHGVGEVTAVETKEIAGYKKTFYILRIVDSGMKVMVPTDAADRVGLRGIISKKEADKVIGVLREATVVAASQPWNRRHREYVEMLKSGSLFEVAKVLRDLTRLKTDKDLSFGERRLLDQARSLLVTELALARKVKEDRVEAEIQTILAS